MVWNIYDVLEELQKRPGLFLGSNTSFSGFDSFITGFMLAARKEQLGKPGLPDFGYFDCWLLGHFDGLNIERLSVGGFWHIQHRNLNDDKKAFQEFFRLLEIFKQSSVTLTRLLVDQAPKQYAKENPTAIYISGTNETPYDDVASICKVRIAHSNTTWIRYIDSHDTVTCEPWYWNETEADEALLREFGVFKNQWTITA